MNVFRSSLLEGVQSARGIAVVVDVYRAFSCTPLLFSLGVRHSILVGTPEEALALKAGDPETRFDRGGRGRAG